MKTLVLANTLHNVRVEIKADIFATNAQLQTAGFDTRFTAMEISDTPAAIAFGINVTETEQRWQDIKAIAVANNCTLTVIDINENNTYNEEDEIVIVSVTITPATVSKAQSTTQQFTLVTDPVDQEVVWTIDTAANLSIDQSGLATIGVVTPGDYTITVTSVIDPTKIDTSVLTVTAP